MISEGAIFLISRAVYWMISREARWAHKPKRCKTRRDKVWDKRHIRLAARDKDWREATLPLEIERSVLR